MVPEKVTLDFDDFVTLLFAIEYLGDILKEDDLDNFFGMTRGEFDSFVGKMNKLDKRTLKEAGVIVHHSSS